jgi:hypothetical protein
MKAKHACAGAQVLRHRNEALLVRTRLDLDSGLPTSFDIFYALLPATNVAALIAKRHAFFRLSHSAEYTGVHAKQVSRRMHAVVRVASREELLPSPLDMPEEAKCDPATLTGVTAVLDALSCPAFSPFDLSTGAAQLLQVRELACMAKPGMPGLMLRDCTGLVPQSVVN